MQYGKTAGAKHSAQEVWVLRMADEEPKNSGSQARRAEGMGVAYG